jgi:DNA-binding transcriptional MocR family regulator
LAHQLGISKNTVQSAYDELLAQDVLTNRARTGCFVRANPAVKPKKEKFSPSLPQLCRSPLPPRQESRGKIELSTVFIGQELLPREKIAECFRSVLKVPGLHAYYHPQGYTPLREKIAQRLRSRGIDACADDVIITTGSQQALDIVCRALSKRVVATENPAYFIAKALFQMNGIRTVPLALDPFQGIDRNLWKATLRKTKPALLYMTTYFQNPTGYSYSPEEIQMILELSQKLGFGILEDDWGSDMLSFTEYRLPIRAQGGPNVLYMNSFTKKLLPSLRLGYLLANESTLPSLVAAKRVATLANPTLIEAALFEFLDRGYYDGHLRKLQSAMDRRYQHALSVLSEKMPEEAKWSTPGGGPEIWLELPRRVDLKELRKRLEVRDILIELTDQAFFQKPHLHGIRLGYAFLPEVKFEKGIQVLATEIKKVL